MAREKHVHEIRHVVDVPEIDREHVFEHVVLTPILDFVPKVCQYRVIGVVSVPRSGPQALLVSLEPHDRGLLLPEKRHHEDPRQSCSPRSPCLGASLLGILEKSPAFPHEMHFHPGLPACSTDEFALFLGMGTHPPLLQAQQIAQCYVVLPYQS